jgi:hypothetical protein
VIEFDIAAFESLTAVSVGLFGAPRMRALLAGLADRRWGRILAGTAHDTYHRPGYVGIDARREGGQPRGLIVEDGARAMLLPLVIRPIPGGGVDAVSPYGYPGPIMLGTHEPQFMSDALNAGVELLRSEGIVSLFVRLHPLLNPIPPSGVGCVIRHGDTVAIDLSLPAEVHWQQTRRDHRRVIRKSNGRGHQARVDTEWKHFETFKQLYRTTMTRVNATPYYFFPDAYFDGLRTACANSVHLIVVEIDGQVATAALELESNGIVQDHLAGTDDRFLPEQPEKLMLHFVRGWAKSRGNRWLHLGGGVGAETDSLLMFKAGFSPSRHPFHTLRVVVRDADYRQLVAVTRPGHDPADLSGFFPAYRAR